MKERVAIIFGGKSSEYEVSISSAASVIRAIDKEKYDLVYIGITKDGHFKKVECSPSDIESNRWVELSEDFSPWDLKKVADFALPIVHGPNCEDGKLQGILELVDIPYGGCGVLASAVAMDKIIAKDVFRNAGIPVVKDIDVFKGDDIAVKIYQIENTLGFPVFVKPANMGSSVGITKAHTSEELMRAIEVAFRYDKRVIVEEAINAREIETGVLGNSDPKVAVCGEIVPKTAEFYDYEAKYTDGASRLDIPANIPDEVSDKIRAYAIKAYKAIDGEGFSRCDFFLDKENGNIYLNEINTIPGFTRNSMFPLLWEGTGKAYKDTIEEIIRLGHERYNAKNSR